MLVANRSDVYDWAFSSIGVLMCYVRYMYLLAICAAPLLGKVHVVEKCYSVRRKGAVTDHNERKHLICMQKANG